MPVSPINVRTFDHVTIVVSDLKKTEHFYVNVLGLEKTTRPSFDFKGDWYEIENTLIHVILSNDESGLAGPGERGVKSMTRGQHVAFQVSDFDLTVELIRQHGIPIAAGPKKRPDGAAQVYIHDPDGHLIELCSTQA
jgi:catechol 2,3-dioxygenase-like lactoylglutathione lyase family enzyme